ARVADRSGFGAVRSAAVRELLDGRRVPARPQRDPLPLRLRQVEDLERGPRRVRAEAARLALLVVEPTGMVGAGALVAAVVREDASGAGLDRDQRGLAGRRLPPYRVRS